ncbi:hypothetical protein F5Y00DRAFT_249038 [Daldinia vernicosa]|uniref:uncharacterized protein n=1 Tax=Daldinia vernicosa TaxID=114800 RepID=UPI002008D536|nr:uncharacterized protein F5Y00DRAFT_249038 [Daldinia vernicosa]KAI0844305.1 hypothetical protein F5Y00DRAFT_249038 [Daldinia vernicosa]
MSSKELLGDIMVTLLKKTRLSIRSKAEKSGPSTPHDDQQVATTKTHKDADKSTSLELGSDTIPLSCPPSYGAAVTKNEEFASPEWVDTQESLEGPPNPRIEVTETQILDIATSCFPPIPHDAELPPLPKPVLIPRVDPGLHIPFARAWAPELANHAVTPEDLLTFIDNLNILIRPHIAGRAALVAALAVEFIPYDGTDGIAAALALAASIGMAIVNHRRCKKYFNIMNEEYFHPRKLHAKIISPKRIMKMFNLDKKETLLAPLTEETLDLSNQERCIKYMSKWACELSFADLPPPNGQTTVLAKMAAWEVKHKIAKAEKQNIRSRKRAWKRHMKGKKLKDPWLERGRAKSLDWILIQNLEEWEAAQAEKEAKREKKQSPR